MVLQLKKMRMRTKTMMMTMRSQERMRTSSQRKRRRNQRREKRRKVPSHKLWRNVQGMEGFSRPNSCLQRLQTLC